MAGPEVHVYCPRPFNPEVEAGILKIMGEDGLSPQDLEAAFLDIHMGELFDVVITLSEEARELLPTVRSSHRIHCPFPGQEAVTDGSPRAHNDLYRLRNEIRFFSSQIARDLLAALR
jgi:hypothetical protein